MGKIVALVQPTVSDAVVAALRHLLAEALAGQVVGIACVVVHPGRDFSIDLAGTELIEPHVTRGMVCVLDDEVAALHKEPLDGL